jgi:hypothetical protein
VRLVEALKEHDLHWVVEQVEQEVRLGKTSEEEIQTFSESPVRSSAETEREQIEPHAPAYRGGRKAKFVGTREYRPQEVLEILVSATERAVVDTAEMESEIQKHFAHAGQHEIVLIREDPEQTVRRVSPVNAGARATAALKLRALLDELRGEV